MDSGKVFADRHDAGAHLGKLLEPIYNNREVLVLGIPRGGVVVAYEVARILKAELSVIVTKKLPHPLQEELAIGACAEDGSVFLTSFARGLAPDTINKIVRAQSDEIRSRIDRFRGGKPLPGMRGKAVLIVDDGIATGSTIVPALKLCRSKQVSDLVVASPVSGRKYVSEIDELADEVFVAETPSDFYAVGQVYEDFHHMADEEVTEVLESYNREFDVARHSEHK